MIKEMYKNSPILGVIKPYLLMSEEDLSSLGSKEKSVAEELINFYNNTICIK